MFLESFIWGALFVVIMGLSEKFLSSFFITHFFNPPRYMKLVEIIKSDNSKKTIITAYQFIAPALSIYDFSPNQWHHATVSFPIKGQKYFPVYKKFFINE